MKFVKVKEEELEIFKELCPILEEGAQLLFEAGLPIYYCEKESLLHTETEEFMEMFSNNEIKIIEKEFIPKKKIDFIKLFSSKIISAKQSGNLEYVKKIKNIMEKHYGVN